MREVDRGNPAAVPTALGAIRGIKRALNKIIYVASSSSNYGLCVRVIKYVPTRNARRGDLRKKLM